MASAPLVVIVGPTASGKTRLAVDLAKKYQGEIICADSRTIFKGMDIGTAKPTKEDQANVPHWGLDLVEPGDRFTAADFQKYANAKIQDIRSRGKIPFLVGGTGLYIDSVIFEYKFGQDAVMSKRKLYESMTLEQLYKYCDRYNIELPENNKNKRYIIRAIEQNGVNRKSNDVILDNTVIVGISTDKDVLRTRIQLRNEQLFEDGVVNEAKELGKKYGWESQALTGNIYRLIAEHINNRLSIEDVVSMSSIRDWQLAKRQLTWFRRNKYINWLELDRAEDFLSQHLENWQQS